MWGGVVRNGIYGVVRSGIYRGVHQGRWVWVERFSKEPTGDLHLMAQMHLQLFTSGALSTAVATVLMGQMHLWLLVPMLSLLLLLLTLELNLKISKLLGKNGLLFVSKLFFVDFWNIFCGVFKLGYCFRKLALYLKLYLGQQHWICRVS